MTCSKSVKTSTGTFSFYEEELSLCEAKLKCIEMGQILAPIAYKSDADKIVELFNTNYEKDIYCTFNTYNGASYWIGLDVAYNGTKQERVFTNGIKWNEKTHGEIYTDYLKGSYAKCTAVMFQPTFTQSPFFIEADYCESVAGFVCLKSKNKKSAAFIIQEKNSLKNVFILPAGAALVVLMTVSIFVLQSQKKRFIKALGFEKEKGRLMEYSLKSITIEGRRKI